MTEQLMVSFGGEELRFELGESAVQASATLAELMTRAAAYGLNSMSAASAFALAAVEASFVDGRFRYGMVSSADVADLPGWSFARSSAAFETVSGELVSRSNGVPRIANGLLIEPARTNLLVRSQEFDNASWTKSACTITANVAAAPDGTTTADKLVSANATSQQRVEQAVACSVGVRQSVSIYVKPIASETRWFLLRVAEGAAPTVWFDLDNAVVGTAEAGWLDARVEELDGGWCRVSASYVATATSHTVRCQLADGDGVHNFTGNGSKGMHLWGAQWEAGGEASSYIATTSGTASRAADQAAIAWAADESGFILFEAISPRVQNDFTVGLLTSSGAPSPVLSTVGAISSSDGGATLSSGVTVAVGDTINAALTWDATGRAFAANGFLAKDANGAGAITTLRPGNFGLSDSPILIRKLVVADGVRLTDADCLSATLAPSVQITAQGVGEFAPGAGVVRVIDQTSGRYVDLTHYQYGASLKHDGQIFEFFLDDDPTGLADLSVRGIAEHRGSRINSRNGADTISMAIGAVDDRAGLFLSGDTGDMPEDMRLGHGRADGVFAFVTGIGDTLESGTEVARIGEEGLRLKQRASAPSPPSGTTVIWAKTDGTVQKTSNVGGTTTTAQL